MVWSRAEYTQQGSYRLIYVEAALLKPIITNARLGEWVSLDSGQGGKDDIEPLAAEMTVVIQGLRLRAGFRCLHTSTASRVKYSVL